MSGLQSTLIYECSECGFEFMVLSEPEADDIARTNDSIVLGCISSGIGFYQLEGLLTAADLPCHNYQSYCVAETVVGCYFNKTALESMSEAALESANKARDEGRVTEDSIPYTSIITDGTYQKRSYASGLYNSSSGAAVAIDKFTNKIIDAGVANQSCSQCQNGKQPYHLCWYNYLATLSSTQMESSIILELFQCSVEKNNLIYKTLISDGDSSVHQAIVDNNVYGKYNITVDRINCVNHLLRRLSKNLRNAAKSSQLNRQVKLKKAIIEAGVRSSKAIRAAARHWNSTNDAYKTKIIKMQEDLDNIPFHAFGQHGNCCQHYCDNKPETDNVLALINLNVWNTILGYYARCISLPEDILLNSSNNPAECANNVITSKIGGKRIDFCKLGGYTIRVAFAVTQFNSKNAMCDTFVTWGKRIPERLSILENKREKEVEYNNRRYTEKGYQTRYTKKSNDTEDCYYGPRAGIAVTPDQFEKLLSDHREKLRQLQNERVNLERETVDQAKSVKWHTFRRLLLTASKFKDACKSRTDKTKNNVVKSMLYPTTNNNSPPLIYGKNNEANALDRLEEHLDILVEPCGLFIDDTILGFGATPDGLVGQDGIVEIKCPYTLRDTEPSEAIKKGSKWGNEHFKDKNPLSLRTSSSYYYQVQGQLHITKRQWCILYIWTPKASLNLTVHYNEKFWNEEMFPRLNDFYWKYVVPELLNPTLLYNSTNSDKKAKQTQNHLKVHKEANEPLQEFYYGEKIIQRWFSLTPIVRTKESQTKNHNETNKNPNNSNDSNIDEDMNYPTDPDSDCFHDDDLIDDLCEEDEYYSLSDN